MANIGEYSPKSGRTIKEDDSVVNLADKIDELHAALVTNGDAKVQLSGSIDAQLQGELAEKLATIEKQNQTITQLSRLAPSSPPSDFTKAPGGKVLLKGNSEAGFYGFLQPEEFGLIENNPSGSQEFDGDNLALALGISQGTSQFSDTAWMKFSSYGKILFRPVKTIRRSISWNAIYNAGAVYGDDSVGICPPNGRVGAELSIDETDNSINIDTATDDGFLRSSAVLASAGDTIVLAGFGDNDGEHEIESITDTKIIVTSASTLVDFSGTNDSRIWNKDDEVAQNAIETIGGLQYRIRLMKGAANDPVDSYSESDRGSRGDANEWNRLILPLHERAKDGNWNYPAYAPENVDDWGVGLTDENMMTHNQFGNGSYHWCQEVRNDTQTYRRVVRGYLGASYLYAFGSWITGSYRGWSPVLELL